MRVLILNRFPLASVHYRDWMAREHRLWMITSSHVVSDHPATRQRQLDGYEQVIVADDYASSAMVEYLAHELHAEVGFDAVVAMSEFDLLRAATLREAWGAAGQRLDSVVAYRDKHAMKTRLRDAGVPVAEHAPVEVTSDLLAFVRDVGYPVVVKPRRGASSVGVRVIGDEAGLRALFESWAHTDDPRDVLVERYIPNEMFNVDGIVIDGEVRVCWPSATTSCLAFDEGDYLIAAVMEPDQPWRRELTDLTRAAIAALPTPPNTIFHAEVFLTPDGGLYLNEIGCRIGGAKVRDIIALAFGVDMVEWRLRHEFGTADGRFAPPSAPRSQSGYALVPPRPGIVRAVPERCPVEGVVVYEPRARPGDRLAEPVSSIDSMAALAAVRPSSEEVLDTLRHAAKWVDDAIELTSA